MAAVKPTKTVKPEEIRAARKSKGLTQAQAAALLGYHLRAWRNWESDRPEAPRMRRALFETFLKRVET